MAVNCFHLLSYPLLSLPPGFSVSCRKLPAESSRNFRKQVDDRRRNACFQWSSFKALGDDQLRAFAIEYSPRIFNCCEFSVISSFGGVQRLIISRDYHRRKNCQLTDREQLSDKIFTDFFLISPHFCYVFTAPGKMSWNFFPSTLEYNNLILTKILCILYSLWSRLVIENRNQMKLNRKFQKQVIQNDISH